MPCFSKRMRVCRVSSQARTCSSPSTRMARRVMSSRFPIGVAMMKSFVMDVIPREYSSFLLIGAGQRQYLHLEILTRSRVARARKRLAFEDGRTIGELLRVRRRTPGRMPQIASPGDYPGGQPMPANPLADYLKTRAFPDPGAVAYIASLQSIAQSSPEIARSIVSELEKQRSNIKLIASENYSSLAVQLAMGNLLTDKYAEGYPRHRFYAGNDNVDDIEERAQAEARALFGAEYANVQAHCGADANLMAYWAILTTRVEAPALKAFGETNLYKLEDSQWLELRAELGNQRLLGLNYYSGGHLTHGYRYNLSARMFDIYSYSVRKDTFLLDYDEIEQTAREVRPLILLAGYSAYPRKIDFRRMRAIADSVGAVLMVDMAHFAGLVAGGVFTGDYSPFPHAHVVTTTTHKTLRGPRAGMVLSTAEFADALDKSCPLMMGGPLPHVVAAKAVALREARSEEFRTYAHGIVENAQALSEACVAQG